MYILSSLCIVSIIANLIKFTVLLNKISDFLERLHCQRRNYYQSAFDCGGFQTLQKVSGGGAYHILSNLIALQEYVHGHRTYKDLFICFGLYPRTGKPWLNTEYFNKCAAYFSSNWLLSYRLRKLARLMAVCFATDGEPKLDEHVKQKLDQSVRTLIGSLEAIRAKYNLDPHVFE